MIQNRRQIRAIILTGMLSAIIAVLSQIAIPMPSGIPITLQTFAIALAGFVLGWKLGGISVLVYILMGAVGVPVFSGFGAGVGWLLGKTGGFLWGFLFLAIFCGIPAGNKLAAILLPMLGLLICHAMGVFYFSLLTKATPWESAAMVSLPYFLKDVFSVYLAQAAGAAIKKSLRASGI